MKTFCVFNSKQTIFTPNCGTWVNFYEGTNLPIRFESSECRQITSSLGNYLMYKIIVKLKKALVVLLVLFAAVLLGGIPFVYLAFIFYPILVFSEH